MKYIDWDTEKNEVLKNERDIRFEDILVALDHGDLLDILEHSNRKRYPNQRIFIVAVGGYAYLVPFVEDEEKIFLKTIIPSRKATKHYLVDKKSL
jgi:uncharacterized DUF497 family protein